MLGNEHTIEHNDVGSLRSLLNYPALLLCLLMPSTVPAQDKPAAKQPAAAKPNPAYAQIEDQPGLPRVLILGDSISIGYTVAVREGLAGKANLHRPATNCSSTRTGVAQLEHWLGDKPWDVIHFNFGLHDLKYVLGDSATLVDVNTPEAHRQVPIEEYEKNLTEIVERLKQTEAKLIWCATTPVPAGANGRLPDDVKLYNAAALRVMEKHEIAIDDLNAFAEPQLKDIQRPKDVHYTPAGSKILAGQVVESILKQLGE
jgi:hypothetical protein